MYPLVNLIQTIQLYPRENVLKKHLIGFNIGLSWIYWFVEINVAPTFQDSK